MIEPAPGVLLIADPFLKDPNFLRTVILICEHKQEGSLGFVLNKQIENTLDELIPGLEDFKFPVFYGGPVQMDSLHFLHQYPDLIPGSLEVSAGVFWGGDFEIVQQMIRRGEIKKRGIRFYVGYSGWSSGQLLDELNEKSWLTVEAEHELVFHKKTTEIWKDSLKKLGGEFEMMINFPIDPQLN